MSTLLGDLVGGPLATRTSEGIAHVIRKAILAGTLGPGQQLRERRLAEELQVSRTPIREALFTLHGEGLIDLAPHQAARVRAVTPGDIAQIYTLRKLLEAQAARAAAETGDRAKIDAVAGALAAQRRLGTAGSPQEQAEADFTFHDAIAAASGSQLLLTVERQVLAVTITHRSRYKYSAQQVKRVWRLHAGILEAIEAGDGDLAEALMASHIAESTDIAVKHFGGAGTGAA
ncbi:MAG: GntR family transcriptional regulator [Rhodospirillaceae bacterium]|nr:GntR family transcriptional regulator [Rhodospirillaceae bacterium]